jgi:hypothetical protein
MGEAKRKLVEAGAVVVFDLAAPKYMVTDGDRRGFESMNAEEPAEIQITRMLMSEVVKRSFPQDLDRQNGKIWAAWLEALDESTNPDVTMGQVIWFRDLIMKGDLKLPANYSQIREAMIDYLETFTNENN